MKYQPNLAGNVAFGLIYAILGCIFSFIVYRHKNKWAICLPVGAIASSIGFFCRIALDPKDLLVPLFVVQNILIIATPSAFLAFNYMLYGRLITALDPQFGADNSQSRMEKSRYSFIPPRIVGRAFIWSDVTTFLLQVAAGSMIGNAGDNRSLIDIGDKLFLVGVCAQGVSYSLFTVLLSIALMRLVGERRRTRINLPEKSWMGSDRSTVTIFGALYFSSFFIIVRSVYRIVEFIQGHDGYLISEEVFLFALDAVPLVLAIGIWAIFWPPVLLERIATHVREGLHAYSMESGNAELRIPSTDSSYRQESV
ncbi:MAG: RTA1 like protein-domain-containing protein [Linnemannia gamsii]|nr:MAG: RTA1 like protein-domain-containing protein [Linnemannia gamsii]